MKSTITALIVGLLIVLIVGGGGYLLYKKFKASADVPSGTGNCELADFNKDGAVNSLDLNMLITAIANNSQNPKFDLNKDGKVDNADIDVLMKCWSPAK